MTEVGQSTVVAKTKRSAWRYVVVVLAVVAVGILMVPATSLSARLVWNTSASAPAGLYWIDHNSWRVRDRVAVAPAPDLADDLADRGVLAKGKLLIKTVAAAAGDKICRHDELVEINGKQVAVAKRATSSGVPLPNWQGCVTLDAGQIFLLGETDNSFDGRYFGVTMVNEIVGRGELIFSFRSSSLTPPK